MYFFIRRFRGVLVREDADGVVKWEEAVSHAGDDANRANGAEFLRSAEHVHERPVHAANRRTAETVPAGDGDEGDEGDGSAGDSTATIPGDGSAGDSIATILGDGSADDSTATIPGEDAGAALPVPGDGDVVAEEDAPFVPRRRAPRKLASGHFRATRLRRAYPVHASARVVTLHHGIETVFAIRVAGRDEAPPFSRVPVPERRETIESGDVVVGGRRRGFPLSPLVEESPESVGDVGAVDATWWFDVSDDAGVAENHGEASSHAIFGSRALRAIGPVQPRDAVGVVAGDVVRVLGRGVRGKLPGVLFGLRREARVWKGIAGDRGAVSVAPSARRVASRPARGGQTSRGARGAHRRRGAGWRADRPPIRRRGRRARKSRAPRGAA